MHAVSNWNLTVQSTPKALICVNSVEDVCAAVKDPKLVSPVLAVGSLHSVNACITSTGTILNVSGLNTIFGVEDYGVRVQAGVKLADLHDYLAKQDLEVSFSPEIGDATVGSLTVCTSKDSSLDGPGYLAGLVKEVTYVNEVGQLVTLERSKHPQELATFTCSYGMMGIVVEVVLEVRKRIAVTSYPLAYTAKTGQCAAAHVARAYTKYDNLFAMLVPGRECVVIEARNKSSKTAQALLAKNPLLSCVATCGYNNLVKLFFVKLKYKRFLIGNPMGRKMTWLVGTGKPPIVHYRRDFVNRYPPVKAGTPRLDFSFVEFQDMDQFETVVAECWDLHNAFKARTGFAPSGYVIYFAHRGWTQEHDPKAAPKPYGNFSGQPGTSFMLDPITGNCDDPRWALFNSEYTAWAVSRGGIPSLSQTKGLQPGQVELPAELTRERFLTPYYASFVHRPDVCCSVNAINA